MPRTKPVISTPSMPLQARLYDILSLQPYFGLYHILGYPIPRDYHFFGFDKKYTDHTTQEKYIKISKTRDSVGKYTDAYCTYIKKYHRLFRSLPHIDAIYICNSLSFNAVDENSDIDLFFVVKKGKLRRARLRSVIMFTILGLKRIGPRYKKKFCLSFYVTQDNQNIYDISIPKNDVYLAYRLAHLVPLYTENTPEEIDNKNEIYIHNQWIQSILPAFPMKHIIHLPLHAYTGKTRYKQCIEYITGGRIGTIQEYIIAILWLPILRFKKKKLGSLGTDIIIRPTMLKFYADRRKKIALLHTQYCKKHFPKHG